MWIAGFAIILGRIFNACMDAWMIEIGTDNLTWHIFKWLFFLFYTSGCVYMGIVAEIKSIDIMYAGIIFLAQWQLFEILLPFLRSIIRERYYGHS